MTLIAFFLFCIFHCLISFINGVQTDFSKLTTNQTQLWIQSLSKVNSISQNLHIEIASLGTEIEIPLYDNISYQNRSLFKQDINKQVDWYIYKNEVNTSITSNIYDQCHGTLFSRETSVNLAGTYLYIDNEKNSGLGIILVELTKSFQWLNNSKIYLFNKDLSIKNGTQLILAFETDIYYNSNSDLINYNKKIDEIIQQANISIKKDNQINLEKFFSMENLSCQRHSYIINNNLRLLAIVCIIQVTFKCPLQTGSSCWIEDKRISNIQLNIDSKTFISNKMLTVRIDV